MRVEQFGSARLFLARWEEVVEQVGRPAAIITDPPYGQNLKTNVVKRAAYVRGRRVVTTGPVRYPHRIVGDDKPFDPTPWLHAADRVLLWGAHRFADRLPPGGWLVWDKRMNLPVLHQGCGEAAWLNRVQPMRIVRVRWSGFVRDVGPGYDDGAGTKRVHPTQKPVRVMEWCIQQARVPTGGLILDPFAGSGSTGVAAIRLGHPFVGVELEPQYFEAACRRLESAALTRERAASG